MAYDNPGGIITASIVLELIAFGCVVIRFMSLHKKGVTNTSSEWLILASKVCATGLTVMEIYGVSKKAFAYPLGGTIENPALVNDQLNTAKHIELSFLLLGIFTLGLVKASVTCFFWRIFSKRAFRNILTVWLVIIVLWTAAFVISGLLECGTHLTALFGTPQDYIDHCGASIKTGWAMVGSDVGTDFITLIIPIPMVWSLQMPVHRKIAVAGTFMIGSLSVGASIAKAYIYIRATKGLDTDDALLTLTALSVWNLVEVQVGIIAACGPTLRPILGDLVPRASLISLLDSLRNQLSFTGGSSREDASTKGDLETASYARAVSGESLVNHDQSRRGYVEDLEMTRTRTEEGNRNGRRGKDELVTVK